MVILGGHSIESKVGFSIYSDPNGGITEGELIVAGDGSDKEPLETFSLSGLAGMS
jgi:hypothetical protein